MTETIEYEQFDQGSDGSPSAPTLGADSGAEVDLSRLSEIPMELSVEIGRTHMTVGETLDLRIGSVVTLERLAGETADLLVNGSSIARGEVVVIDEQYGLRVTEILDGQSDAEHAQRAAGGEADGEQVAAPAAVAEAPPANTDAAGSPSVQDASPSAEDTSA